VASGDIFVGILRATSPNSNDALTTFTYRDVSSGAFVGNSSDFSDALLAAIQPVLVAITSAQWTYTRVDSFNLFNPVDIGEKVNSVGGEVSDETNAPFVAWAFRTSRVRRDIRRGQKRFAGVPETWAVNGELQGDHGVDIAEVFDELGATLVSGTLDGVQYQPVIVKRVKEVSEAGNVIYRLPNSQTEMGTNFFAANAWEFVGVSHQVSRHVI